MSDSLNKRIMLRKGLKGSKPLVAIGSHDALTARLVENYGFDAVWVSGLGVSTMTYALPDINLITMTEALAAATRINASTSLPIIADCDNGYGALSNVVRTVREYDRAGIAGICIEDNIFPKRSSLYHGEFRRELIPIEEQARRIRAAKEAQQNEDFVFIARVEALIAAHGVEEACMRADAYVEAGADAILIHSRDKTMKEIEEFLNQWKGKGNIPLVAVPTMYPTFSVDQLYKKGFQMIIFANQTMRAAVRAMEETLKVLKNEGKSSSVDKKISSIDHIFDLVNMREFFELENKGLVK